MYHPVLMPKRSKFGFLKGPNPKLSTSIQRVETLPPIPKISLLPQKRFITSAVKPVSYRLEQLQLSYELKTKNSYKFDNCGRSPVGSKKNDPLSGSLWTDMVNLENKQTYVPQRGSNVQNLKNHHFLNVISYVKTNTEADRNHHHRKHKSSSNKCLVCRYLINSNNESEKKLDSEQKPQSAKSERITSSRFRDSLAFDNNDDNYDVRPLKSRDSNTSEKELVRLREKISQTQKDTEQPRIKLNLWLA